MTGRRFPFGYGMELGRIIIIPEEAAVVSRIFTMRLGGAGTCEIGRTLYDEQIPFFSESKEKAVKKASAILYKPVYIGNEKYPAIISKEHFSRVQEIKPQAVKRSSGKKYPAHTAPEYELHKSEAAENLRREIERLIESNSADRKTVVDMVFSLSAEIYSCIITKEGTV